MWTFGAGTAVMVSGLALSSSTAKLTLSVLTTEASVQANLANIETYKKTAAASTKHNGRQTEWELISDPREARKVSWEGFTTALTRPGFTYQERPCDQPRSLW